MSLGIFRRAAPILRDLNLLSQGRRIGSLGSGGIGRHLSGGGLDGADRVTFVGFGDRVLLPWLRAEQSPKGFGRFSAEQQDSQREGVTKDSEKAEREGREQHSESTGGGGSQRGKDPEPDVNWMRQGAALFGLLLAVTALLSSGSVQNRKEISFHSFLWDLVFAGKVEKVEIVDKSVARVFLKPGVSVPGAPPPQVPGRAWDPYYFTVGSIDSFERKLEEAQEDNGIGPDDFVPVVYNNQATDGSVGSELIRSAPSFLIILMLLWMVRGTLSNLPGVGGRNIFQVGKANPVIVKGKDKVGKQVSFSDVAGLDEAKLEIMEFVDFLKNPKRYEKLGAKIPRGALLVGPPGTGKTLLAKATAGEANVPFFSMSGSDFIEMFVGVGPARVRDLFQQARSQAPCIVFIDEIDAVGRARGRGGFSGGNDERENTLNALLVEMDGFSATSGVVVLAGTNRADILDKALLRPGRFDRQVLIDKPDIRGRYQIFMVHLKNIKLAVEPETVAKQLASLTPGFAGADIANICNEGALIAARNGRKSVEIVDFEAATDRVLGGIEKKNRVISRREKEIVAHHEAGHAVAGWFSKYADPLMKVSIIPRGEAALGFAQYMPVDKKLLNREQLEDFTKVALGGRVAESLCFDSITTGAIDDLQKITKAVYAQVTKYGMTDSVGKVFFPGDSERQELYKPYSEETARMIDDEARDFVENCRAKTEKLLSEKIDLVKALAAKLLEKEVLREDDLVALLGPRPYAKIVDYDTFVDAFEKDRQQRTKKSPSSPDPKGGPEKDKPDSSGSNVELELA
ncbi:hypothetical protein NDN08_000975 [Rhodosorus marinus]|uniref:AAA+ ATPase domain-containing protein n=1 Tax=Rhodosorus marinus TaxID=101924 RepID=A0AAV8UPM6_9RHOD|nr:hypothetical protein NDN08_000975 [Rhodosorus marinus]